jgi:hypothetical protein
MLRRMVCVAAVLCVAAGPTTRPTTRPSTQATSAPARVRDGLMNGAVRFLVPAEWKLYDRTEDGKRVFYHPTPEKGEVSLNVIPQPSPVAQNDARVKQQMSQMILGMIKKDLQSRGAQMEYGPKVEPDQDFLLKVHSRYRDKDVLVDVVHLYRGVGSNLVGVRASLQGDVSDEGRAKRVHEAGAMMLLSVTLAKEDPKIVRPVDASKN